MSCAFLLVQEIAELYEQEQNFEKAMAYYDKAADLFQGEEVTSSANQCRLKLAQFAAELQQYEHFNHLDTTILLSPYDMISSPLIQYRYFVILKPPSGKMSVRYQKAIEIFEEIARNSVNSNLLKYGVKGHLLNAGICQLCKGDAVAITNALDKYQVKQWIPMSNFYFIFVSSFIEISHECVFAPIGPGPNFCWYT